MLYAPYTLFLKNKDHNIQELKIISAHNIPVSTFLALWKASALRSRFQRMIGWKALDIPQA